MTVNYRKKDGTKGTTTKEDVTYSEVVGCHATPAGTLMTLVIKTKSGIILKAELDVLNNVLMEV